MPLKPLLIYALETGLNQYLALDETIEAKLAPLSGKIIALTVQPFNETIYLCPSDRSIQCLDCYLETPDAHISGSLAALGLMGLSASPMRAIFSGKVNIEGDVQVGKKLQELFAHLDLNLEGHLAKYTGAEISGQISQVFKSVHRWTQDSLTTFKLNTSELLQEETRDLPAPAEAELFYQQVDKLRNDFDRLQARLDRLSELLNKPNTLKS